MTFLDTWIQQLRIKKIIKYIPDQSFVLDIGCHNGELFTSLGNKLKSGIGIDPLIKARITTDKYILIPGYFPEDWHQNIRFDCITLLAVLEHVPIHLQETFVRKCFEILNDNGRIIITVPSRKTEIILSILQGLHLIKGMSLDEHYGFDEKAVIPLLQASGFQLVKHEQFQLGLNNLFIFTKIIQVSPGNILPVL